MSPARRPAPTVAGQAATAWDACARLLATLPPDRSVVCVAPPGSWTGWNLSRSVAPDRLLRLAPPEHAVLAERVAGPDDPVFLPGDQDATWRRSAPLPWPAPPPGCDIKLRRLDTLLDPRTAPGLLVIEAADAPAILRGAAGLLAAPLPPAILLDLTGAASVPAAWAACVAALGTAPAHAWHDDRLAPCTTPTRLACALPPRWPVPPPCPPAARQAVQIPFDADLPTTGFHRPEPQAKGLASRWSGPEAAAGFVLPCPGPGAWDLHLQVRDWGACGSAEVLRLFAGGRALRRAAADERGARFAGLVAPAGAPPSRFAVDLVTPPPQRRATWDPRRFGVEIAGCTLIPA